MQPTFCVFCKSIIPPDSIFCPQCGKNIKEATSSISLLKQIGIYLVSILLPPLGLVPGIKYIRGKNQNGKMVGTIAILLTIVGTVISIVVFLQVMDTVNKQVESQLQQYENLGY